MPECEYCTMKGPVLFEDEQARAFLSEKPAAKGHTIIVPKEHLTILEQMPDPLTGHLFALANRISTVLFETLRTGGTNILVENGVAAGQRIAHVGIHVIPRKDNDGLAFNWKPQTLSEEEMGTAELQLKDAAKNVSGAPQEEKKALSVEKKTELLPGSDEDNYLIRQLRRIP